MGIGVNPRSSFRGRLLQAIQPNGDGEGWGRVHFLAEQAVLSTQARRRNSTATISASAPSFVTAATTAAKTGAAAAPHLSLLCRLTGVRG